MSKTEKIIAMLESERDAIEDEWGPGYAGGIEAAIAYLRTPDGQTEEALLPCPFCGREASVAKVRSRRYWALCDNPDCYIQGPCRETKAEAIKAWNTRTPEGQEMWAVETQVGYSNFLSRNKDDADYRRKELDTIMPEIGPCEVVPVLVTKKED